MTLGEAVTGLSYVVGAGVFFLMARRKRMATEGMGILAGVGFVAGIVGAKLTQTVASGLPLSTAANPGGRALLGGLLFGWLGVEVAKRAMGLRRSTGDLFALALPAGEAVGRIGCALNGCCYGVRCDAPWAVWSHGALRFPSQLLSSAVAAGTFGLLWWLSGSGSSFCRGGETSNDMRLDREENEEGVGGWSKTALRGSGKGGSTPSPTVPPSARAESMHPLEGYRRGSKGNHLQTRLCEGDLFRLYLVLFGVTRFGLEFVRWRESLVGGLSPMQWFCLDLVAVGGFGLLRRKKDDVPQLRPGV